MTDKQLLAMLTQALKDKAPRQYSHMQQVGTLKPFLNSLLAVTLEAIETARQNAIAAAVSEQSPTFSANPLDRTQVLNSAQKEAEAGALAQALETIEALSAASGTTTASSRET